MKNLLASIIMVVLCATTFTNVNAQGSVQANCRPDTSFTKPGLYPKPDSLPCLQQGVYYTVLIQFKNFDTVRFAGSLITLDSVRIDTVGNLPCGYSWSSNKKNNVFKNQEAGCIVVEGKTTDPVGQYRLNIVATAFVAGTPIQQNASALGLRYDVRVVAAGASSCPAIDTSAGATLLTPSCKQTIFTGIAEVNKFVSDFACYPNPTNGVTEVAFTSTQDKAMTFRVYNLLGSTVHTQTINASFGRNTITFDGSKLESGVYFYSINDGVNTVTNRLVITK